MLCVVDPGGGYGVLRVAFVYGSKFDCRVSESNSPPLFVMIVRLRSVVYKRKGSSIIYYSCGSREVGLSSKECTVGGFGLGASAWNVDRDLGTRHKE